jgi:putative lipoic acid-binding regulatory protein
MRLFYCPTSVQSFLARRLIYGIVLLPMHDKITCMEFPCSFPLKVMGLNSGQFESVMQAVIKKHMRDAPVLFESRPSSSGKYLSVTATFTASSREQLDALYRELNNHEMVVMTL